MIGAYLDFIRIRFLMMLAYRVNYYSGIIIYAINIGAYYFLWHAIYGASGELGGFTLAQMTTYVAISWMARAFYFNNLDQEIATEIRDGSVAVQLIRPISYLMVKLMQGLGEGIFRLLLFSTPGMVLAYFLFQLELPASPSTWALYGVMLLLSFLLNTQINLLTGLFAFFVDNNQGMIRMKRMMVDLFSGLIVPISFFPGWSQDVLQWLPFQAITYLPAAVLTGRIDGTQAWFSLGVQLIWLCVLLVPIWLIWRAARKRLSVQGG